jgi:hypothetical protein
MSRLLDVVDRIRETDAAIAETETAIANNPEYAGSLSLTLGSYARVREELEATFEAVTASERIDVCRYRLFDAVDISPSIRIISKVLHDFQDLVTTVYDALDNKPNQRVATNAAARAATTFGLAYTFSGSLGMALTIPTEQLLTGETTIDGAIDIIFEIMKSDQPEDIRHYADELGSAPIKLVYEWAKTHADAGIGAEVQWMRKGSVRADVLLQHLEMERLETIIAQTSETSVKSVPMRARLVGIDSKTRTFHLEYEGDDVKGKLGDTLPMETAVEVPAVYDAVVDVKTVTALVTGRESSSYVLTALTPLSSTPLTAEA